jgi:hypothetical protein
MDRGVRSMLRDVIAEVKVWQLIEPSSSQYQMQSSNAVQRENGGKRTNEVRWLERQLPLLRRCILSSKADELTGGQHRGTQAEVQGCDERDQRERVYRTRRGLIIAMPCDYV